MKGDMFDCHVWLPGTWNRHLQGANDQNDLTFRLWINPFELMLVQQCHKPSPNLQSFGGMNHSQIACYFCFRHRSKLYPFCFSNDKGPLVVDHLGGICQNWSCLNEDAKKPGSNEEKREDQPENDPLPCSKWPTSGEKRERLVTQIGLPFMVFHHSWKHSKSPCSGGQSSVSSVKWFRRVSIASPRSAVLRSAMQPPKTSGDHANKQRFRCLASLFMYAIIDIYICIRLYLCVCVWRKMEDKRVEKHIESSNHPIIHIFSIPISPPTAMMATSGQTHR